MTTLTPAEQASRARQPELPRLLNTRRGDPLPPGVFVVEYLDKVAVLRMLGPGLADLWLDMNRPPEPFGIQAIKVRGTWVRLEGTDKRRRIYGLGFGEYGPREVGQRVGGEGIDWDSDLWILAFQVVVLGLWHLLKAIVLIVPRTRRRRRRAATIRAVEAVLRQSGI